MNDYIIIKVAGGNSSVLQVFSTEAEASVWYRENRKYYPKFTLGLVTRKELDQLDIEYPNNL